MCICVCMYTCSLLVLEKGRQVSNRQMCVSSVAQSCQTPWTVVHQAPQSMGFSRQEYWSRLPFSLPGESSRSRDQTQVS